MRLPNTAHTSRPWRIHEIARDFRLEDVWALPTPGGPDDFPRLVRQVAAGDPSRSWSGAARALWALRWKVGELLGWDRPDAGLGSRVPTLRDRLPADLRDAPSGPDFDPFTSLYLLEDHGLEWIHPPAPLAHPFDYGAAAMLERSTENTGATLGPDAEAYRKMKETFCAAAQGSIVSVSAPREA
jgi:hypothetical protein